ncbi:MAG: efflux RND transporter permease subunit, partial [Rikenellaceae bacterium]
GEKSRFFTLFTRWFDDVMGGYTKSVGAAVRRWRRTALFTLTLLMAIWAGWRLIPEGFLPEEDQGYVMVVVETPPNSSLQRTLAAMEEVSQVILADKDVESISYAAGFNLLASISSTNSGIIFAELVDYSKRKDSAAEIASKLNDELYVATPSSMSFAFIPPSIPGLGMSSGVTFEVQDLEGRGAEYLWDKCTILMDSLHRSPIVATLTTQYQSGVSQRELSIDTEHAVALGISPSELYSTIGTMLGSTYINNFNRFGRLYETYIEAAPEFRLDESSLSKIYISNGDGDQIPLSTVVDVRETTGVEFVSQFNLYRSVSFTLTPSAKYSSAQAMDLVSSTIESTMPPDIGMAWSGVSYVQAEAVKDGAVVYLLAIVFVFLALAALYNSWGMPFAILLSAPVAVLGALIFTGVAHLFNSLFVNDIYMQISLVMLIGLAAKNAILVVEYADRIFFEEGRPLIDSAIEAAKLRVRPIVMTAFAFILGVMPLVFASGVYATARNIMGVALVGGMLFATLLGVFLYPALYYMIAKIGGFEARREKSKKR